MPWLLPAVLFGALMLYFVVPQAIVLCCTRFVPRGSGHGLHVRLTFDDGPDPESTRAILQVLLRHGVRATFFVLGERAQRDPEAVRSIVRAGHLLGVHGHAHLHPWTSNPVAYMRDLIRGSRAAARSAGIGKVVLFRPTYGKANLLTVLYVLFTRRPLVLWSVDPQDYAASTPDQVVESVVQALGRTSGRVATILLHDGRIGRSRHNQNVTPAAVELLCKVLRARGHELDRL